MLLRMRSKSWGLAWTFIGDLLRQSHVMWSTVVPCKPDGPSVWLAENLGAGALWSQQRHCSKFGQGIGLALTTDAQSDNMDDRSR